MFTTIGKCKMSKLITEYHDWADKDLLRNLWGSTVVHGGWKFGQKSNNDTIFPMWFQNFYNHSDNSYTTENDYIKEVADKFMELCPDNFRLVRIMVSGNTYGQDGDIHDDWLVPGESLTGVLYLNRIWEDNWGGETVVYDKKDTSKLEISKLQAGKLIVFDGSNPHIGKGPQRNCGELRSIVAIQAIQSDAWQKHIDNMKKKS